MFRTFLLAAVLTLTPGMALAQQYPQIVIERTKLMANTCTRLGGKITPAANNQPFVYHSIDLNGDGRNDWVLDARAFNCAGKPNLFRSANGATLEVFVTEPNGAARSAFIGDAWTYRITNTKPAKLFITQRGAACGGANKLCEKQLLWNAATKKFTLGAASAAVAAGPQQGGQQASTQGSSSAGGFSGPAFTITAADKTAAFKAAGFKQTKRGWQSCTDQDGATSASYSPGSIVETSDLNNDGRPEIWLTEGGAICYGMTGSRHFILAKTSAGQWKVILDAVTFPTKLSTRTNGWQDFEDGGPGMGPFGKFKFDGAKYVLRR